MHSVHILGFCICWYKIQIPIASLHQLNLLVSMSRQDFLVVLAWFVDTIAQGLLPLDPLMLRLLRLVKLQLGWRNPGWSRVVSHEQSLMGREQFLDIINDAS